MYNRHYAETFDDEMTGVHAARRNAQLEEEERLNLGDDVENWERKLMEQTLFGQFRKLKKALIKLRDEILISLRLKKRPMEDCNREDMLGLDQGESNG